MTIDINHFVIRIAVVFVIYYLFFKKETFTGEIVTNAYSDLFCLNDTQPLVRFIDNKTFQCLSADGVTCVDRNTLEIPNTVTCAKANEYLSKDGIRNIGSKTRKLFDTFESGTNQNMKLFTCNSDGLRDQNHWCGKMYQTLNTQECSRPDVQFRPYANQCKNLKALYNSPFTGQKVSIKTNADIQAAKAVAKAASNAARARVIR